MNIELYIQSGIVESYTLGLATPAEAAEFEQLLPHFPELGIALQDFGYQLELFTIDHEVPPPRNLLPDIEARMRETPTVRPFYREHDYRKQEAAGDYIRVESNSDQIRVHKYWRTAFIAIFIFSKILLVLSIYYFLEYRHAQEQVQQLRHEGKRQ